MKRQSVRLLSLLLILTLLFGLSACNAKKVEKTVQTAAAVVEAVQEISEALSSKEDSAPAQNQESPQAQEQDTAAPVQSPDHAADTQVAAPAETPVETQEEAPAQEIPEETPDEAPQTGEAEAEPEEPVPDEDGIYTSKEEVALYIHLYGHLPSNYITKNEAKKLGWPGGKLETYAPGKCIGGDRFGNREGLLPGKEGRTYTECDIDTMGAKTRGAKRIVFSNDGLIYYTEDHYETFELLYGEE